MVLERLVNLGELRKPSLLLAYSSFITLVSISLAFLLFPRNTGLVSLFFITISFLPIVSGLLRKCERELKRNEFKYKDILKFYFLFFLGVTTTYFILFIILPENVLSLVFHDQIETTKVISGEIGDALLVVNARIAECHGATSSRDIFLFILQNNLKVLYTCILLSLLFSTGALFIISWNSSVIATAIGIIARSNIYEFAQAHALEKLASYFAFYSISLAGLMIHGFFELSAYFLGGVAGGILSVATVNKDYTPEIAKRVLLLIIVASLLILLGAFIEVYITPLAI